MIAGLVLVVLVLLLGLGQARSLAVNVAVAAAAVVWLVTNSPMEGPVLFAFTRADGLTVGDLTGLAALALVGWRERDRIRRGRW